MQYRHLIIAILAFPLTIHSQDRKLDTIPYGSSMLKTAGAFTYETIVDTVNTIVINEFLAKNSGQLYDNAGDDDDWFEIYNYGEYPILVNNLCFTDDQTIPCKWKIDSSVNQFIEPGEHMLFWADGEPEEGYNHTSFKLSGDGEYLGIYNEDTTLIDQILYGVQSPNISYGRFPDAGLVWNFFTIPTPNSINSTSGATMILPSPNSNLKGGVYTEPVTLNLSTTVEEAKIMYTTDCADPDSSSILYSEPVLISSSTIIKARLIKQNAIDGQVLTISIIFDSIAYDNPVISLVADPNDFFGESGLISKNNSTIEVPANLEYIVQGQSIFNSGTGIQLHSPKTVMPNSLRLYARSRYGNNWFEFPFFENSGPDVFKRLILRNSANDNVNKSPLNTHFRDPLIQNLAKGSNINPMVSESLPVNVFLNGNYHGIFNLRERIDKYYIQTHTDESDGFDLLERAFGFTGNNNAISGSFEDWNALISFADTTGDLSQDTDLLYMEEQVDLKNFTDYWITEVFVGNYDWLSNNVKFWKPENGKWQWIYWDTDHGLGLNYLGYGNVTWNTLEWSLTFSDRAWSTGHNNILIRNLLKNNSYREYFIKRFTHLLNTSFSFDSTRIRFDAMKTRYQNDMTIHAQHWQNSTSDWENAVSLVKDYLQSRPAVQFGHIKDFFGLEEPVNVSIKVQPSGAGTVSFAGEEVSSGFFQGKYFPGMSYNLAVEPSPGYTFTGWSPMEATGNSIDLELSDSIEIIAHFVPLGDTFSIHLTEVYCNNRESYDCGDWIEFFYDGFDSLDLTGWYISGTNDEILYSFEQNTFITPGDYFIVAEDLDRFYKVFPDSIRCYDNYSSGFFDMDTIQLRTDSGHLFKEVTLMTSDEWPALPGEGYSLEIKWVISDPNMKGNWEISENTFGSPGLSNHLIYDFQRPIGKDSTFNNQDQVQIPFFSSGAFYYDPDGHDLAGISVNSIEGPGEFSSGDLPVIDNETYQPSDFTFFPGESLQSSTILNYSFIDHSGQESLEYRIEFLGASGIVPAKPGKFLLYPTPARQECFIEIPSDHKGPIDFLMFDLNGRILKKLHIKHVEKIVTINLSELDNGLYLYSLWTNRQLYNGKIEIID